MLSLFVYFFYKFWISWLYIQSMLQILSLFVHFCANVPCVGVKLVRACECAQTHLGTLHRVREGSSSTDLLAKWMLATWFCDIMCTAFQRKWRVCGDSRRLYRTQTRNRYGCTWKTLHWSLAGLYDTVAFSVRVSVCLCLCVCVCVCECACEKIHCATVNFFGQINFRERRTGITEGPHNVMGMSSNERAKPLQFDWG